MIKKKINDILSSPYFIYVIISFIMAMIFCLLYGTHILNPTYTEWLFQGNDLSQHYLGWKGYRASKWFFPIGCTDLMAYPYKTSVIFTDSIPLFAVIFKILSPVLPSEFQYFGLWGLLCFILQGILSVRIIRQYANRQFTAILISILFAVTPIMVYRMFVHTALAAHWILLLALEPVLNYRPCSKSKEACSLWATIGLLASSIHIYFIFMCGIILIGYCLEDILVTKKPKRSLAVLTCYLLASIITISMLGGFSSGMEAEGAGWGQFITSLDSIFLPSGWSSVFKDIHGISGEGFAYLGAGCIFLFFNAVILFAGNVKTKLPRASLRRKAAPVFIVFILSFITALLPNIVYRDTVLFSFQMPDAVAGFFSVFRASGRFVWIPVYLLLLCSCIIICKSLNAGTAAAMFVFCLLLQIYDIYPALSKIHDKFRQPPETETLLSDRTFWDMAGSNQEIEHIIFSESMISTLQGGLFPIADWALDHGKTINDFYFARSFENKTALSRLNALLKPTNSELFLFPENEKLRCLQYDLNYYYVDGFTIGYSDLLPNMTPYAINNTCYFQFKNNQYLKDGLDHDGIRTLYPGGLSYGPYCYVPKGSYTILIRGKNLNGATIAIHSEQGKTNHDYDVLDQSDSTITLLVCSKESIDDLEILVQNNSGQNILLYGISLHYEAN